jgi:uncharacterized membrane protein YtjA (UPF0391 family)
VRRAGRVLHAWLLALTRECEAADAGACGASIALTTSSNHSTQRTAMLHYAVVFFVIALIAAVFGFSGIAAGAASIAQVLFVIFLVLAVVSFVANLLRSRT